MSKKDNLKILEQMIATMPDDVQFEVKKTLVEAYLKLAKEVKEGK
jgi:hypothetical protein